MHLEWELNELPSPLWHKGFGLQLSLAVRPITRDGAEECRERHKGTLRTLLSQVTAGLKVDCVQRLSGKGLEDTDCLLKIWLLSNLNQEC